MKNIELTLDDRDWPRVKLIVKADLKVVTESAPFDSACPKFQSVVNSFIETALSQLTQRRKSRGN